MFSKFKNNRYKILFIYIFCMFFLTTVEHAISFDNHPTDEVYSEVENISSSLNNINEKSSDLPKKNSEIFEDGIWDWNKILDSNKYELTSKDSLNYQVRVKDNNIELIIGYENYNFLNSKDLTEYFSEYSMKVVDTITSLNAKVIQAPISSLNKIISDLNSFEEISYVKPNNLYHIEGIPNDPYWADQWGPQRIQAPLAWNIESGDLSNILVCVIDTGIDYTHPDLVDQYVALGYDWVNDDADPMDDHSHGTHCAGTIAATINNSIGVVGMANVSVMAEKFLAFDGYGDSADAASAVVHATDAGADILSNSWGGGPYDELLEDAFAYAIANDVVIIAAAGNSGTSTPQYPAFYDDVIAVSGTQSDDGLYINTNYGAHIEVAAPAVNVYSTVPVSMGSYGYKTGTSMACPHVAGVAALIRSVFPSWTTDQVRERLHNAVDDLGDPGWDQFYGYGLTNAYKAVLQPEEHDIKTTMTIESIPQIGVYTLINVTAKNIGLNTETSVNLQLWIEESMVYYETISTLDVDFNYMYQYSWTPMSYGDYNITAYAVPVSGENILDNNKVTIFESVVDPSLRVGFITTHGEIIYGMEDLEALYEGLGYVVDVISSQVTPELTNAYGYLFGGEGGSIWDSNEITAIENFVSNGGTFTGIGDSSACYGTVQVAANHGITFLGSAVGLSGSTTNFNSGHPVMLGITSIYLSGIFDSLAVAGDAVAFLWDSTDTSIFGASVDSGSGHICVLADDLALDLFMDDNALMFVNILEWISPDHELVTFLENFPVIPYGESIYINATVTNTGSNTEYDVGLQIWIEEVLVDSTTYTSLIPLESQTLQYLWSPTTLGSYNITAYTIPVADESSNTNNKVTKYATVSDLQNYNMDVDYLYNWIDVTGGTLLSLSDDSAAEISLPFTFNFYDQSFTSLYVSSNGWFSFYNTYPSSFSNVNFPSTSVEHYYSMALFWDDLYPSSNVYYQFLTDPNRVVVAYVDMDHYGSEGRAGSFELILSETGEIVFQYDYIDTIGSHTVGLNYGLDSTYYNQYTGLTSTTDDLAILFSTVSPDHELKVQVEDISNTPIDEPILVNATVSNRGTNEEYGVELQLWIDDSLVNTEIYSTLSVDESQILQYLWTPSIIGTSNITAYAVPVTDEYLLSNNVDSTFPNVFDPSAMKVAVLNSDSGNQPSFWTGGWANDYNTIYNGLLAEGVNVKLVTNFDILSGGLADVNILIMIDNAPNDAASDVVKIWCLAGGNVITFDSSICFINWAGILPPEAEGTNGKDTYWDYNSPSTGVIVTDHPIVSGYTIGETIYGTSGDAQYYSSIMQSSAAGPYYTPVVKTAVGSDYDLIVVYEPPSGQGAVVQMWDAQHWSTTTNQLLILNSIYWLQGLDPSASIEVLYPNSGEIVSGIVEISWTSEGFEPATLNYSLLLWNESSGVWIPIVNDITETEYLWDTTTINDGQYRIRVEAYDGSLSRFDESDFLFTINNVNEAPSILVLYPNGGETVDDTITITWSASDSDYDTLSFTVYYRESTGSWIQLIAGISANSYAWNTNSIVDGDYYIRIVASDGSLTAEDTSDTYFTITHVNNAPILNILQPKEGHVYYGDITIQWYAVDPENDPLVYNVYYWNGSNWVELATSLTTTTSIIWDTTSVPNGFSYKIKVTATDGEFTTTDETYYFSIHNVSTSPTTTTTQNTDLELLAIVTLTITILGLIIGYTKRRKS